VRMLRSPVGIDTIPSIAAKLMVAFGANFGVGFDLWHGLSVAQAVRKSRPKKIKLGHYRPPGRLYTGPRSW